MIASKWLSTTPRIAAVMIATLVLGVVIGLAVRSLSGHPSRLHDGVLIQGDVRLTQEGELICDAYNGTTFWLESIALDITVANKNGQERVTRRFRLSPAGRVAGPPQAVASYSCRAGQDLFVVARGPSPLPEVWSALDGGDEAAIGKARSQREEWSRDLVVEWRFVEAVVRQQS